ncbi:MAG: M20/M25/M40 family metallo-hydrolase [Saprospiraceae bacterium]|nr:M20/M25/M40 family metallo-hydrolase [Saprospiraceae bacterium]
MRFIFHTLFLLTLVICTGHAQVLEDVNAVIRKHAMEQGEVMDIASWITDVYGPRLTGSPMLDKATHWATQQLASWGMQNVHLDEWGPFGRGWELQHFEMHMTEPSYAPIIAYPKAWSPSTDGEVVGEVIYLDAASAEELKKYQGRLAGKIIFLDTKREVKEPFKPDAERLDDARLLSLANQGMPTPRRGRGYRRSGEGFSSKLWSFLAREKPLVVVDRSFKGDLGTVFVAGASVVRGMPEDPGQEIVPQVTMSVEHYNRVLRLMEKGISVSMSLEIKSSFTNTDQTEHNVIAEIPGTDLVDEVVMFGAHFDSWHAGSGATDNGAGSAVIMEVARILLATIKETGIRPRRTLRLALWTGEEQGMLGSRAYIRKHLAKTDRFGNPSAVYPAQDSISAYYNFDNGTGKIRGIHLQGNTEVAPIFRKWLEPFGDLGAKTLTWGNTGGTDHLSFDGIGIPGFQFIQDPIAYGTRTHHSNMDNWDHLIEEDLKQAATIIASLVFHTAQRDERLPRKSLEDLLN